MKKSLRTGLEIYCEMKDTCFYVENNYMDEAYSRLEDVKNVLNDGRKKYKDQSMLNEVCLLISEIKNMYFNNIKDTRKNRNIIYRLHYLMQSILGNN